MTNSVKRKIRGIGSKNTPGEIALLILSYILLITVALIVLIPIFYLITLAFDHMGDPNRVTILPEQWSFRGFTELFTNDRRPYMRWYLNTILVGGINMLLVVVFVTPTAYAFSRMRFRGRKHYMMGFMLLQMFPGVSALVAYYVLLHMLGLLGSFLGLSLIYACVAVPGSSFLLKGFFDTIPKSLEEAARLDGASRIQTIIRILLPIGFPMIGLIAIFGFAVPFGDFLISNAILPDNVRTMTLAVGLQRFFAQEGLHQDYAMFGAGALLAAIPMTVLYIALQKIIFKGMGGMTGAKA